MGEEGGLLSYKTKQPLKEQSLKVVDADATPLTAVAEAFEQLARFIQSGDRSLRLSTFGNACSLVSVLFGCLGFAFKFAELEYVAKVHDLIQASNKYETLQSIIDNDVKHNTVRHKGSHSRNLRRVRLGLGLIQALFENFLATKEGSLKDAATTAYGQVCAPFHNWAIRQAVGAGMYALPTRDQLISRLNETDNSVQKEMRRYIDASSPIIQYIDDLYISRNISLDW
ncbi:glycolipid transfer protein (GLTP) family protein [Carex rostrata]